MKKLSIPSVAKPKPRSWLFALLVSLVLGVLVLIDRGSVTSGSGLASPCRVEVIVPALNVRADPDLGGTITGTLHRGDLRGAETTVQGGFRRLTDGGWVEDDSIRPLPGSKCAATR